MERYRFHIRFHDRVGMVRDIAEIVAQKGINILSLAVYAGEIYLHLDSSAGQSLSYILQKIKEIPDVFEVVPVEWMPHELAEQRFRIVLDAVQEGIISVDLKGVITTCNPSASQFLSVSGSIIGESIDSVLGSLPEIMRTIQEGRPCEKHETVVTTPRGKSRFLLGTRPIFDDCGRPAGAVITLQKMSEVRRLLNTLTRPVMVTFDDIVYSSTCMSEIIGLSKTIAKTNSTVLLRGETGTGKELFARAIHMASPRHHQPFIVVNMAAIPDTLIESELFGYAEGTFTGGRKGGRQGLFEFAHKGTIFLDEISEIPPYVQAKLLRVLQEGTVRRLGEVEETPIDVRIIAATNRNLEEMVARRDFREDLFYRLSTIPIYIPPLRERKEDIPILVQHFISKFNHRFNKNVQGIAANALQHLLQHDWPGNVRELENVIERAMNLATGPMLQDCDINFPRINFLHVRTPKNTQLIKEAVGETEKEILMQALARGGSIRQAAKILGVSHTTVINKMRRYNLDLPMAR